MATETMTHTAFTQRELEEIEHHNLLHKVAPYEPEPGALQVITKFEIARIEYALVLERDRTTGVWAARCPVFPAVTPTHGASPGEVIVLLKRAVLAHIRGEAVAS